MSLLLLWQVAGELLSCLRRWGSTGKRTAGDVDADIQDILAMFPLELPTKDVIPRALGLHSRYSLSHWDSMLVAACVEAGVDTLYSEDMDDGATYDSAISWAEFIFRSLGRFSQWSLVPLVPKRRDSY